MDEQSGWGQSGSDPQRWHLGTPPAQGETTASGTGWGTGGPGTYPSTEPDSGFTVEKPPYAYVAVAGLSVLISAGLLLTSRTNPALMLVAWLLAGPVTIVVGGLFIGEDARRRARATVYDGGSWTRWTYATLAVTGIVLAAIAAWNFGDWVGRQ